MNRTDLKAEKYNPSEIEPKWPHSAKASRGKQKKGYDPNEIEKNWQRIWEEEGVFRPNLDTAKKPFYCLMMFPYPSAEGLHAGNMYAFTGADIYGRFMRMKGFDVFEPIGLDGFGIHSENYALKVGRHPVEQAKISEENFYRQLHRTGNSYDWSRKLETYDPNYYKWTQWIFTQMFKKGLAVRKKAPVNFCPSCKTVLADEQVIDGKCERCSSIVEKKDLEQWFFKITDYADRLLEGLSRIDWSEKVKIAQRQWIGKSEGAEIRFKIDDLRFKKEGIIVYTVFPETIFGVTYMVLAPEHPLVEGITTKECRSKVIKYVETAKKKTERERITGEKEKTGVFTGSYCINPVNGEKVPIWVADYVLAGYGTGAVMGVPGSDHRDFAFAKKYDLPIIRVIGKTKDDTPEVDSEEEVLEEGYLVNSDQFTGLSTPDPARKKIKDYLEQKGWGKRKTTYHLRDWLISRQRYWGPPIPMIYCESCSSQKIGYLEVGSGKLDSNPMYGWYPVPEKDLPVELPYIKDYKPLGTGESPLAHHPDFYEVKCPACGSKAKRETDVSDTFLDSAWYFFRYISIEFNDRPFDKERAKEWLPVHMYIGGAEHSVLHLLYSRFITMFFYDLGLISFEEPYARFFAHGLLIKEGAKMSKSRGNVVVPDAYIKKFGVDTMRCYLMFLGPFSQGGDFRDTGIEGMNRFLKRVWTLITSKIEITDEKEDKEVLKMLHKTIKGVTGDLERLSYNTSLAKLMEFYNVVSSKKTLGKKTVGDFLKLLAPFAPHMAEELYQGIILSARGPASAFLPASARSSLNLPSSRQTRPSQGSNELRAVGSLSTRATPRFQSIHHQPWPSFDPKLLEEEEVTIVVQVNGKVRDSIKIKNEKLKIKNEIEEIAKGSEKVKKYLDGKTVKKVVYVEGKIINFVTQAN